MQGQRNIAARAGRWSARHRKTAILGWITFVVLAFMIGGKVGQVTLEQDQAGVGDSGKASKIVSGAFPDKHEESVLVQSKGLTENSPQFKAVVADVEKRLEGTKGVTALHGPYDQKDARGRPVQVVQHHTAGLSSADQLQHAAHRPVGAVALVGHGGVGRSPRRARREDALQLVQQRGVPVSSCGGRSTATCSSTRVHPHAERHVALELGGGAADSTR